MVVVILCIQLLCLRGLEQTGVINLACVVDFHWLSLHFSYPYVISSCLRCGVMWFRQPL